MTQPFQWRNGTVSRLIRLHKSGYTIQEIAVRLRMTRETVRTKLESLPLDAQGKPIDIIPTKSGRTTNLKLAPVTFPHFEDHPDADKDRYRGRKPQPQSVQSQIGCSAHMCVGG